LLSFRFHSQQRNPVILAKVGRTHCTYWQSGAIRRVNNQIFTDSFIRRTSHVSGEKITASLVLVQHKGNKRIGEGWKRFCHTSHIGPEIAI
jgi:hypothetical protein